MGLKKLYFVDYWEYGLFDVENSIGVFDGDEIYILKEKFKFK